MRAFYFHIPFSLTFSNVTIVRFHGINHNYTLMARLSGLQYTNVLNTHSDCEIISLSRCSALHENNEEFLLVIALKKV
jgi:hypothetical protein